jgi:monoamine oxidase
MATLEPVYRAIRPNFVKYRFMDWPSDPWSKASYSFPAPGQVTAQGPTLRQGIGRLHFAGEYTSYAFMGYMEGALNSGAAAAKRIAEKDGILKKTAA